jgi:uncharacterized coiled-coil protein SlyX
MTDKEEIDLVERLREFGAYQRTTTMELAVICREAADEIERLRRALELLTDELPEEMHALDEPDEDWEVIVKMRAIAREAVSSKDASEDRGGSQ